jgi:hypothetical protein
MFSGSQGTPSLSSPTAKQGVVLLSGQKPLYWSTQPFGYQSVSGRIQNVGGEPQGIAPPPLPDNFEKKSASQDNSNSPEGGFSPEEAKRISVLVQTDNLLDNPKFEPIHASLLGLQEGAKIGALIGLPLSLAMMLIRKDQVRNQHSLFKKVPHHLLKLFGFKSIEHLANEGKDMTHHLNLKRFAKVVYGTGLSAAIGGLFFGPVVSYLIVANARTQLLNIKRAAKEDYAYEPDWIDKHFSHIHKVEDPVEEYNKMRQELTNRKDAAANGFHTAVFVKLLTLGSKFAVAGIIGGLFETARHSWGYLSHVKDGKDPEMPQKDYVLKASRNYFGKESEHLELDHFLNQKKKVTLEGSAESFKVLVNDTPASTLELEKVAPVMAKLAKSLEKTSFKNWATYVGIRLQHSPVTHLLKETGVHLINPLMLGNFFVTPAVVALSMIPFFVKDIGIEPYRPENRFGNRWKKFLQGIRLTPSKKDKTDVKSPAKA